MKSKNATPENMIWKKKYNTRKYDITTKIKKYYNRRTVNRYRNADLSRVTGLGTTETSTSLEFTHGFGAPVIYRTFNV